METEILEEIKTSDTDTNGNGKVILFNDDWHTFDQVIHQLMLAIKCSHKQGEKFAWIVHTEGKCQVYTGVIEECLHVSAILEEIELKTEIEFSD